MQMPDKAARLLTAQINTIQTAACQPGKIKLSIEDNSIEFVFRKHTHELFNFFFKFGHY